MKNCQTCGMPMIKSEDFAAGDEKSDFCLYCVNEDGSLKTCQEIFEGGIEYFMEVLEGDIEMAEKITRKNMSDLPYWQTSTCDCLTGDKASDYDFAKTMKKLAFPQEK